MSAVVPEDSNDAGRCGWKGWKWALWNSRLVNTHDDPEVRAYILSGSLRGPCIGWITVFSVLALTGFAETVQDCITKKVNFFGAEIFTSSVVSTVLSIEGVVNAILSPLVGGIADGSDYRTELYQSFLLILPSSILVIAILLFFEGSQASFLLIVLVLVVAAAAYELVVTFHSSYLPELAMEMSDEDSIIARNKYASKMYSFLYGFQLIFVVLAIAVTLGTGVSEDNVVSAQVAALIMGLLFSLAAPSMFLFEDRRRGEDKVKAGFLGIPRLYKMIKLCITDYKQLGLFLVADSLYISGAVALVGLVSTYIIEEMGIEGFNFQVVVLVVLVFTIPGALLIDRLTRWTRDVKKTLIIIIVSLIIILLLVPLVLIGEVDPDAENETADFCAAEDPANIRRKPTSYSGILIYLFSAMFGLQIGGIFTANLAASTELIPGGSETAFYGLKTLAGKIFAWSPPLIYTALNEAANENPRIAINAMQPFLVSGLFLLFFVDFELGKQQIAHTLDARRGQASKDLSP